MTTAAEIMYAMNRYKLAHESVEELGYTEFEKLGRAGIPEYLLREDGIYQVLPNTGQEEIVFIQDPENLKMYINVYHIERCYGGPEEGRWYYDAWKCEESFLVIPDEGVDMFKYVAKKLGKFREYFSNRGRYPLHSVMSNGEWHVCLEMEKAKSETTRRPIYC